MAFPTFDMPFEL